MKQKQFIFPATLVAVCLLAGSCSRTSNDATQAATESVEPQPVPGVEVTRAVSRMLDTTVRLPAQLNPYEAVDLYAKETGYVKWIKVDRGSRVKAGEQIAELEAPEMVARRAQADSKFQAAESQLLAAQAKLAADSATYQRMKEAAKTPGVVAGNDLEVAQRTSQGDQANVAASQKNVKAAQDALRAVTQLEAYLNITAPFDGQVTTRYVHPGALVGPAGGPGAETAIVRIETLTRLRLVVPVPEYDAAGIPDGTQVNFMVPSFPGRTFRAPITRISHAVDVTTRTMPVELDVRDPHAELIPGTFCQVEWPVHRTYATLFVPVSAVANNLQRTFVIRVRNNRAEWADVKTGATSGNLIEVFGDLKEGDEVVVEGTDQIQSGTSVAARLVSAKEGS
jgi:membrane fusion protein, multidrug efflux system